MSSGDATKKLNCVSWEDDLVSYHGAGGIAVFGGRCAAVDGIRDLLGDVEAVVMSARRVVEKDFELQKLCLLKVRLC